MELIDKARYNTCIAAEARLRHASAILEGLEEDLDGVTEDEYGTYIISAIESVEMLATIVHNRSRQYVA